MGAVRSVNAVVFSFVLYLIKALIEFVVVHRMVCIWMFIEWSVAEMKQKDSLGYSGMISGCCQDKRGEGEGGGGDWNAAVTLGRNMLRNVTS